MLRIALDGMALRRQGRGVSRALRELFPLFVNDSRLSCIILSTDEGRALLDVASAEFHIVPPMTQSAWEQFGLPWHARRVGADVVYSHAECGPVWGPPLLLHVPEDPFVRWSGAKAESLREHVRRTYQRSTMRYGLHHASLLATSSTAGQSALKRRFGSDLGEVSVVPLGVGPTTFYPNAAGLVGGHEMFHLSSVETRDMTVIVVRAYAIALSEAPDLPDLLIGGDVGAQYESICRAARDCSVSQRVRFLGRISDEELRHLYAASAICIQPSHYEGFGLQPLEALACGAPLIVSPEPAVEEVVGDAAVIARGHDEASLAECITMLWADHDQRMTLRERGPKRAANYSWQTTATLLGDLLIQVAAASGITRTLEGRR